MWPQAPLTKQQSRTLVARAHDLKPVILIGQRGLTEAVQVEVDRALTDHALIKVKVTAEDKLERRAMCRELTEALGADCLTIIGRMAVLYRYSDKVAGK